MKILIDNGDGRGLVDYSSGLTGEKPLAIARKLNTATVCRATLSLMGTALSQPVRNARVMVQADSGVVLFTGYMVTEPEAVYAGETFTGAVFLTHLSALSDEVVLDRQSVPSTARTASQSATATLGILTNRVTSGGAAKTTVGPNSQIGSYLPEAGGPWSSNAAALATMIRAAYRVDGGQVTLTPIGTQTHTLSEQDGTLDLGAFTAAQAKMAVNDLTVCGEIEPQAYVTEIFEGDGTTTVFDFSARPFAVSGEKAQLLLDDFSGPSLNPQLWLSKDSGGYFSLAAAGLSVNGGNGLDGQTTLAALDLFEMGGVLLLEMTGVQITAASDGYLGAFYNGPVQSTSLFAGFHVRQSGGATVIAAVVQGVEAGSSVPLQIGHSYTLRVRVHCRDVQRALTSFYSVANGAPDALGGGLLDAQAAVLLEVQDTTPASTQAPVVIYDGVIQSAPASCTLVAVNSTSFAGSLAAVSLRREPGVWVTSRSAGGTPATVRLGAATDGAQARVTLAGRLTVFPASTPKSGDLLCVVYRTSGRSVARMANPSSIAEEEIGGLPGTSRLVCRVTMPVPRSSTDCENAALALLNFSADRNSAWTGTYKATSLQFPGDCWPGDMLEVSAPSSGVGTSLVVRAVEVEGGGTAPEVLIYKVAFANDWAEALSFKFSHAVPADAWLPEQPLSAPAALPPLARLTVSSVTATQIDVAVGQSAPTGGGFEVRRSDWRFGPGSDGDLVLRTPVPNFVIPREAPIEEYYVRMYDGANPPNYSRFSSAIFIRVMM